MKLLQVLIMALNKNQKQEKACIIDTPSGAGNNRRRVSTVGLSKCGEFKTAGKSSKLLGRALN